MKRFLAVILNPFLLSLWFSILLLVIFPVRIEKYIATLMEQGEYLNDHMVRFEDLDNDGTSEKIAIFHNSLGKAGLTISNFHGIMDQWNFNGRYDFADQRGTVITGDGDGDGIKEIYAFTISGDSVVLHCISNYLEEHIQVKSRFVTRVGNRNKKVDPYLIQAEMDDLNTDGYKELIFGIGTGYSLYPRNVFAWDWFHDTLMMSPPSGFFLIGILQEDLNGDGMKEIIPHGYAASNVHDSAVPYPDWNSWLMVLDRKLNFEFEPVSFPGQFSKLIPFLISGDSGKPVLAALFTPPESQGDSCLVMTFDDHGSITGKRSVAPNTNYALAIKDRKGNTSILLCQKKTGFELLDNVLNHSKKVPESGDFQAAMLDIDLDNSKELIFLDINQRKILIYRQEVNHPVTISFGGDGEMGILYSVRQQSGKPPELYLQLGSKYYYFQYGKNKRYLFRLPIYFLVFASIFLFTQLVRKIQRDQFRRKQENERKITDLQLQIVRNQLDPHFIMNAINSIILSITDKEKEEARNQLLHFSRLHRSLLLSSDKIHRSLADEVEFTQNYLALEKFRFRDKFEYRFDINPAIDLEVPVPKMILQIHVENAIKHGLFHLEKNGLLIVTIFTKGNNLVLQVTDNGVGRKYAGDHGAESTGKGLAVMKQYAELLNSVQVGKIVTSINDLFDESGNAEGTTVTITLTAVYEK